MSKKSKNSYRKQYPCINCSQDCEGVSSILCYGCGKWVHSKCIGEGISEELTKRWSARGLTFYCPGCCFDGDEFDMKSSLLRLRINPKKEIAESEKLLLETYGILLPAISEPSSSLSKDNVSVSILKRFHPVTLEEFRPLATYGDGNCLYRSVSQGLFGSQDYHVHLRLLAAIEIIANKSSYDTTAVNYIDKMMDNRIIVPQYNDIVDSACSLDAFSELIHMYAISAAIKLPVRSYYPPMISSMFHSQPFSRIVVGRGVKTTEPTVTVMWTCTVETKTASQFRPNHFVTLVRRRPVETVFLNVSNESEGSFLNTPNQSPETSPLHSTPVRSSQFSRKEASPQKEDSLYDVKHCTLGLYDTSGNRYACLSSSDDDPEPLDDIKISETNSYSDSKSNGKLYHGKFLDLPSTIELLTDNCIPSLERVPSGKKENEYFLVDNSANARRRQESRKNVFWDDCGVWESKNGAPKQLFVRNGHAFSSVVLKNGLYCYEKQIAKQRQYIPLDPQPSDVITVHRCYAVLKKDKTYRKRVTWMDSYNDRAIYEYIGDFPGRQEHGNNKNSQRRYIRTPAETLEKIADEAKYQYPTNVYDDMAVNDSTFGPRDVKQIKNKKYTENVKGRKTSGNLNNFADNIQVIENIVHTSSFVQMVINCKSKVPSVICYTEEQLQDMKRFCSVPNGTILGFDKTFNLTDIHVTVAVFKNRSVRKHETKENPIFFRTFLFPWKFR